jgi:hypothetical protein
MSGNWNEYNVNILTSIHWRASLVDNLRSLSLLLAPEIAGQSPYVRGLLSQLVEQPYLTMRWVGCRQGDLVRGTASPYITYRAWLNPVARLCGVTHSSPS